MLFTIVKYVNSGVILRILFLKYKLKPKALRSEIGETVQNCQLKSLPTTSGLRWGAWYIIMSGIQDAAFAISSFFSIH